MQRSMRSNKGFGKSMCSGIVDYLSEFSDLNGSMGNVNVGRGSIGHAFTVWLHADNHRHRGSMLHMHWDMHD